MILEKDRVAGISVRTGTSGKTLDAGGRYLLPGIVDLHTDAVERHAMPRPGAHLPVPAAFLEADRQLALAGITTAFDAAAFMDADRRSIERAKEMCGTVLGLRKDAMVRHELHVRCELPQQRSLEAVLDLLDVGGVRLVSVMDHTPGKGQFRDLASYEHFYREVRGATDAMLEGLGHGGRLSLVGRLDTLSRMAEESGAVLASHDDHSAEQVEALARRSGKISEFPVSLAAVRRAKELGLAVCLGAPNALRGRSASGNLSALEAIRLGLASALCSDYHPPAMLHAAFELVKRRTLTLPNASRLISFGPAHAMGIADRGMIQEGMLADLIVVGDRYGMPEVTHVMVGGRVIAAVNATF